MMQMTEEEKRKKLAEMLRMGQLGLLDYPQLAFANPFERPRTPGPPRDATMGTRG